jgi:hypothetical protein
MNQKHHDQGHEEDLDDPTPPGGPQRTDAPGDARTPDPGPAPDDGPTPDAARTPAADGRDLQEENAATSLDQPSQ